MWRIALSALALLAAPACGGEESPSAEETPSAAGVGVAVDVVLTDFAVAPAPGLEPGTTTLRVVNEGDVVHALRVEGPGLEAETDDLAPGEAADLRVDLTEGDVVLWCPLGSHRSLGMEATVAVGAGGGAPAEDTTTGDEEDGYRY
ncbi:MAG TPA: hypothetical protein VK915_08785 [Gaiellaceae bacterium]|nr:hypothetical protein [Gaiellaceae bacterium]